jgi:hypothetical protein
VAIVMTGDSTGKPLSGAPAIVIIWILLAYLACIEGGQNALVGLQSQDPETYKKSHPITYMSTTIARKPGFLEKFIIGRQLITVVVVFAINQMGTIHENCSTAFGTSRIVSVIFCQSGVALIIMTILLGQVSCQVVSALCMLDFINNFFFLVTTYLSIAIEYSGLLHTVHLVSWLFERFLSSAEGGQSDAPEPTFWEKAIEQMLFWGRVLGSLLCLG